MTPVPLPAPRPGVEVRDAVFWDEEHLLLTTPAAEVWRAALAGPHDAQRLFTAAEVLGPVARHLGAERVAPAAGGYPRLAAHRAANTVVVNTHDLVLVACAPHGGRAPALLSACWGHYYPCLAFSADGSRFAATGDGFLAFDTRSWQGRMEEPPAHCAWHPREPALLCLDRSTGRLAWTDYRDFAAPQPQTLGVPDLPGGPDEVAGLVVDPSGEMAVVACDEPPRLEWWQLAPLRRLETRALEDGSAGGFPALEAHHGAGLFAVESQAGVRLWDFGSRRPLARLLAGATNLRFSPSGRRFLTHGPASTSPHPARAAEAGGSVALWQVSP